MTKDIKKIIHYYGFYTIFCMSLFFLLLGGIALTKNTKDRWYKKQIQEVINKAGYESIMVKDKIKIKLPISVSAAFYSISDQTPDTGYAVILRITGMSGPVATVFLKKTQHSPIEYLGTVGMGDNDDSINWFSVSKTQVDYWKKKIPLLLKGVIKDE